MSHATPFMCSYAIDRANQRGIRHHVLDLLLRYGTSTHAGGGREQIYMDQAARRRARNELGKAYGQFERGLSAYLIVGNNGATIITCGHRTRRIWRR